MTKPEECQIRRARNGARGRAFIGLGSKPAVPFGHHPKERSHTLVRFAEHLARYASTIVIGRPGTVASTGACGSRLMVTAPTPGIRSASDSSCNP